MQDRKVFWAENWSGESTKPFLFVDRPYNKGVRLPAEDFGTINDLVFKILYFSMDEASQQKIASPTNHEGILQQLNNTKTFAVKVVEQLDSFVELEKLILATFSRLGFSDNFVSIQFPIDVRVVHPTPPPKYLERTDAVDFLHCDAWRGEPADVVNCVLYCEVSEESSQLLTYDISEIDTFEAYKGSEKEADFLIENLKPVEFTHQPGQAIFFDAYTPHCTKRNGDKIRISLNFSFRRTNPYEQLDERWDRPRQPWSKYWYLPEESVTSFENRLEAELMKLTKSSQGKAIIWRKSIVDKMCSAKTSEVSYAS